jgi:hypothetical protein
MPPRAEHQASERLDGHRVDRHPADVAYERAFPRSRQPRADPGVKAG